MNNFKKLVAAFAAAAISVCGMAVGSSAEAENPAYKIYAVANPESAAVGDEVVIDVCLNTYDLPTNGIIAQMKFNPDELEYVSYKRFPKSDTWTEVIDDDDAKKNGGDALSIAAFTFDEAEAYSGEKLVSFTFKVKAVNSSVTFSDTHQVTNADEEIVEGGAAEGTTVKCAHVWDEGKITTEPTCTEKGVKTYTCTACGETQTEEVPALGHDWGEWIVDKEATETEVGHKHRECSRCDATEEEGIPVVTTSATVTEPVPGTDTGTKPTDPTPGTSEGTKPSASTPGASEGTKPSGSAPVSGSATATTDKKPGGNTDSNDGGNKGTGVMIAFVPAAMALAGVVFFKKRK